MASFARSRVLVLGVNSIGTLLPTDLISQVESLLGGHLIQEAVDLAEQRWKKLQGQHSIDEDTAEELRYVYQRIGFQCFTETRFDDAGKYLFSGELDPRILISYFPDLCGTLINPTDHVDVFAGVAVHMPTESSVDDMIVTNLVRNYAPFLLPDTQSAAPTAELRKILGIAAKDMLEAYLRKWRLKQSKDEAPQRPNAKALRQVVDTVLAKLYIQSTKKTQLHTLLQEPNDVVLPEVEPLLKQAQQFSALCLIYQGHGDDRKLLDIWSKLVDGQWVDDNVKDPLTKIFDLLMHKRDRSLVIEWSIWLMKKDSERAFQLLTAKDKRRDRHEEDIALLQQIMDTDSVNGVRYLEHLVLQKQSMAQELHIQLAAMYLSQLLAGLEDPSTSTLWRAKASSYASSPKDETFLTYFASTTPDSEHKRARLKTVFFLQSSNAYDPTRICQRLREHAKILALELAIVESKLHHHRNVLTTLVHNLRDHTSALGYCTSGGDVISTKTAQCIGDRHGLQQWTSLFNVQGTATKRSQSKVSQSSRDKAAIDSMKRTLLNILLEVLMANQQEPTERTARFLDMHAMDLDELNVVSLVPSDWPLSRLSPFLTRSFRRSLHHQHEGQILKAISTGHNLEIADRTWLILREHGSMVEETEEDDSDAGGVSSYDVLSEKVGDTGVDVLAAVNMREGFRDVG